MPVPRMRSVVHRPLTFLAVRSRIVPWAMRGSIGMMRKTGTVMLAAVLASACGNAPSGPAGGTQAAAAAGGARPPASSALKPPAAGEVLAAIYGQRVEEGAVSYRADDGAAVGYWYGQEFDLDGRRHFVGFASRSNADDADADDEYTLQEGRVAIAQATFQRTDADGGLQWSLAGTDGYVGEFGRNDQAPGIDTARRPLVHDIGDGRLLLAVPTQDAVNGSTTRGFAMFLFDPDDRDSLGYRAWGYLGSIPAGEDNSAACSDGNVMPCIANAGELAFEAATPGALPALRVSFTGTTIAAPGRTRPLDASDTVVHAFDPESGRYAP